MQLRSLIGSLKRPVVALCSVALTMTFLRFGVTLVIGLLGLYGFVYGPAIPPVRSNAQSPSLRWWKRPISAACCVMLL